MDLSRSARTHHDLIAARTQRIVTACVRLGIPASTDLAYLGAGDAFPPSDLAMSLNNQSVDLAAPTRSRGQVRPGP